MPRMDSTGVTLLVAALLAGAIGYSVQHWASPRRAADQSAVSTAATAATAAPRSQWTASAPGRVEPRGGDVRIGPQAPGKVADVLVRINDRASAGDLLVRLDDEDLHARLLAAEAEAEVRRRERDAETVGRPATDRRNAQDAVAQAERALHQARAELDRALAARRGGSGSNEDVTKARAAVSSAKDKLDQERVGLRRVQATSGMPLHTRLEASLAAARGELSLVEASFERLRVRAPVDGTILQVTAKIGESVAPSTEAALILFGDVSGLRVRAEVEERDVSKVRAGQRAVARSDAFPGREFAGKVAALAQSLGAPRLASRGPRRPNDVDVLEVLIDLEDLPPLLPGMRVDVFFAPDPAVQSSSAAARTN